MKHLYAALLATLSLGAVTASGADLHQLTGMKSVNGTIDRTYSYTPDNLVAEIVELNGEDRSVSTRKTFEYQDETRRLLQIDNYQDVAVTGKPEEFLHTGKDVFRYDARGRVEVREIWATYSADVPMFLSSVWRFSYDSSSGLLTEINVYYEQEGQEPILMTRHTYQYDENGKVARQDTYTPGMSTPSTYTTYSYKGFEDRISRQVNYSYNYSEQRMQIDSQVDYVYTDEGAISEINEYNSDRTMLVQQKVYDCSEGFSIRETVYPYDYVESFFGVQTPAFEITSEPITFYELKAYNEYDGQTHTADMFEYVYTTVKGDLPDVPDNPNAIATVNGDAAPSLRLSLAGDLLTVDGCRAADVVTLTDMQGRTVLAPTPYAAGISLDGLAAGAYILTTPAGSAKFVK